MKSVIIVIITVIVIICLIIAAAWYFYPEEFNDLLNKFLKKDIGEAQGDQLAFIYNNNQQSQIAMVAKSKKGQGAVVLVKNIEGREVVDQVVLQTQDGKVGLVMVNDSGLPQSFDFEGYRYIYENYTETTVDITITNPDGTTEKQEKALLNLPSKKSFLDSIVSPAHAAEANPAPGADREANIKSGYYPHTLGQVVNVITCGGSIVLAFTSGGLGTGLVLSCGALTTRAVTSFTEIGPCKGDVLECAIQALLGFGEDIWEGEGLDKTIVAFQEIKEEFYPSGITLKGQIQNSINKKPVPAVLRLVAANNENKTFNTTEVDSSGNYQFKIKDPGSYIFKAIYIGYQESVFAINISNSFILINNSQADLQIVRAINSLTDLDNIVFNLPISLIPDGFIKGEVINAIEGIGYSGIEVGIEGSSEVGITDDEGRFVLQPPLLEAPGIVQVYVKADKCSQTSKAVYLDYEFVAENSDQYKIYNDTTLIPLDESGAHELIFKISPPGLVFAGQVIDRYSKKGLANTEIELEQYFTPASTVVTTSENGSFSIPLSDPGVYDLQEANFMITADNPDYWPLDFFYYLKADETDSGQYNILTNDNQEYNCQVALDPLFGQWEGKAISTTIVDEDEDYYCGQANISINIKNGQVKGSALVNQDYTLVISGTVDENMKISAGMARGSENVASFEATLNAQGAGSGTWSDSFGCQGTLSLKMEKRK